MTASAYMPDVKVEVAFGSGVNTPTASRTWTDVSPWVELTSEISVVRGRGDEDDQVQPSTLTVTFDNSDGRFTAARPESPYYPNVKIGRPIRVTATHGGVTYSRFLGFVESWPVEWEATAAYARATVTAVSRMALIGTNVRLRPLLDQVILAAAPSAYYPLSSGAELSGNNGDRLGQEGVGTLVKFGEDDGAGFDGAKGATFADAGRYLVAPEARTGPLTAATIEVFFKWPRQVDRAHLISLQRPDPSGSGVTRRVGIRISGSGGIDGFWQDAESGTISLLQGAAELGGAEYHHAALTMVQSGANLTIKLYEDGALVDSLTDYPFSLLRSAMTELRLGQGFGMTPSFTLSHAAVFDYALTAEQVAEHASAGLTGLSGEQPGTRLARLLNFAGIPAAEAILERGSVPMGPLVTAGRPLIDLLREAEAAEGGLLFDGADGALTFHARTRRFGQSTPLILSAANQEIDAAISPMLDRSTIMNDFTAETPDGTAASRAVNAASIADYGIVVGSASVSTTDTGHLARLAQWRVNRYGEPRPRIPNVGIDVLTFGTLGSGAGGGAAYGAGAYGAGSYGSGAGVTTPGALTLDLNSRLELTDMPTQAPAAVSRFWVEGYTEVIGPESWFMSLNVSPAEVSDVALLDSDTRGQLDSSFVLAY